MAVFNVREEDTHNKTEYALTCNVIRDFCADAIEGNRLPTDEEIEGVVGWAKITPTSLKARLREIGLDA